MEAQLKACLSVGGRFYVLSLLKGHRQSAACAAYDISLILQNLKLRPAGKLHFKIPVKGNSSGLTLAYAPSGQ